MQRLVSKLAVSLSLVSDNMHNMARLFPRVLVFLGVVAPVGALALPPEAMRLVGQPVKGVPMTLSEVTAMPSPCIAIGMGRINGEFWASAMSKDGTIATLDLPENAMAKNAGWFHHYCWGMLDKHRMYAAVNAEKRAYQIRLWRDEMVYIVDWTAKVKINWAYLPAVHAELAETYIQGKDYPNALRAANTAVELNADYARAYLLLAEIYELLKDRPKALASVTEGLKHVAGSKGLQRRYTELGGVLPFPEPYVKSAAVPEAAATPEPAAPGAPAEAPAAPPATPPEAQPPGNPYCRFCP